VNGGLYKLCHALPEISGTALPIEKGPNSLTFLVSEASSSSFCISCDPKKH